MLVFSFSQLLSYSACLPFLDLVVRFIFLIFFVLFPSSEFSIAKHYPLEMYNSLLRNLNYTLSILKSGMRNLRQHFGLQSAVQSLDACIFCINVIVCCNFEAVALSARLVGLKSASGYARINFPQAITFARANWYLGFVVVSNIRALAADPVASYAHLV